MKPERRGGAERGSIGSSTRHLSTPLRDRSDCLNTPPARRNSPVSKLPRSCDHPSVLDLRSTNLVSARLAAVSEEKNTRRRLRTQLQSQPRHENGVATSGSQDSPVCGPGRRRRVLKTRNKDQLCKTNSPKLNSRRDISVSPAKALLRVRRDMSVSPTKMALRVRHDISVSPTKTRLAVRRKMLPVDAITHEAGAITPRHVLMNSAPVETVTERESPARPVCNDQRKELAGVLEENQQDASEQDTDDVMTGELAIAARRKFCQLDGQYTADGRKVRMASSRFNRRRPQRKASLCVPQRKVSLRRGASRKASMRGCKTVVKNRGGTSEVKVVSCSAADGSQEETDSVPTGTCKDVEHSDANEEKHFDGAGAPSIVAASSFKSVAHTEDSPGRKRGLELKRSPDEACSLLSTQSAHVSSGKKLKLDGKHDVESVEPEQQQVTSDSLQSARNGRLGGTTGGGTSLPEYKAKVSGLTGGLIPVKVQKVKVSRLNSGLISSVQKVKVSRPASELTTCPAPKVKIASLTTSAPVPKTKASGQASELTITPVPKVKVEGLATSTPVPKVKVPGLATRTPVPKAKVTGPNTRIPVQKAKVERLTSSLTSTPVQKAKTSQPTIGLTSTSVQVVKVPGPAARTPMRVHFTGLNVEPPTQARQETQNTSEAAVTSTAELPRRSESARADAPTMQHSPDETDSTEEWQIR